MDDGHGRVGPGGGGGGEAKGEFDVISKGKHVGTGRTGAQPGGSINEKARAEAPGHRVSSGCQGAGFFQILAHGTERPGEGPSNGLGNFLQPADRVDQKWRDGSGGEFGGGGEQGGEIARCQEGIVIDHQEVGQIRKLFQGPLSGGGESASKTEVPAGRKDLGGKAGMFGGFHGGRIGAVIANHGREGANGLMVKGIEKAGEKTGAKTGRDQDDDLGFLRHKSSMALLR